MTTSTVTRELSVNVLCCYDIDGNKRILNCGDSYCDDIHCNKGTNCGDSLF